MLNGAWPVFALEPVQVALVLARGLWLAGLFSSTGALLFRALEAAAPACDVAAVRRDLRRLIAASLGLAALAWMLWVTVQAAEITGADGLPGAIAALPTVFRHTAFGHRALLQLALLTGGTATLPWRNGRIVPAMLALGAVAVQAGHLHAWAMTGGASLLTGSVLLHLWAAAIWLGGLLPLLIVVRAAPPDLALGTVHRFSVRGAICVGVLALSAAIQSVQMLGGLAGIVGSFYGWVAMAKLGLFAVLLGFAWHNRQHLTPLLTSDPRAGRAALARSIAQESAIGAVLLLVAALLSLLPPGMHTQPVWPFTVQPRLPNTTGPFLIPATPTSFYRSTTGYAATAIVDGAALFARNCASCHAAAPGTARSDGDLFWLLSAGHAGAPGLADRLDEDAHWSLIDFLHADTARMHPPMRAPDVDIQCDGHDATLSDLRGRTVHLILGPAPAAPANACIAADPEAAAAIAIVTGMPASSLLGADLEIDANGWLRTILPPKH